MLDTITGFIGSLGHRADYSHLPPALRDEVLSAMEATSPTDIR